MYDIANYLQRDDRVHHSRVPAFVSSFIVRLKSVDNASGWIEKHSWGKSDDKVSEIVRHTDEFIALLVNSHCISPSKQQEPLLIYSEWLNGPNKAAEYHRERN